MKCRFAIPVFLLIFVGLLMPVFSAFAGTVLSGYKYAWSDNVGYINFENVIVSDSALSGYAWSKNSGWLKFNPERGGVLNNGNGNLSSYAWGEQLGWINFDNVSINTSTGKFSGTATGDRIGVLTFNCSNYCDVKTDWRPVSGGSGGIPIPNSKPKPEPEPEELKHIETYNQDLSINPQQSGRYTRDTDEGQIVVDVPADSVAGKTTFFITEEPLSSENRRLVLSEVTLINSAFYNVFAKDQSDNFIHSFAFPLTVTLPVPVNLQKARNLGVYWLNETNSEWVLIPDAVFADNAATFQVNHLTKFAIFGNIDNTAASSEGGAINSPETSGANGDESDADTDTQSDTDIGNNGPEPSLPLPDANTDTGTNVNAGTDPGENSSLQNDEKQSGENSKSDIINHLNLKIPDIDQADEDNLMLALLLLLIILILLPVRRKRKDKILHKEKDS